MTELLILALTLPPGQPVPRERRPAATRPAPLAAAPDIATPPATPLAYPDKASQNAAILREARDRVVLAVGPEAKDFTKKYGAVGIYALRRCGPATGKKLVALAASGGLDRLRDARVALEAVRIHGDPAADWLAANADRLQDPEALEAWAKSPMEFVYDLRDVEQAAEEIRANRRFVPHSVTARTEGNQGYILGGIVLLVVAVVLYLRSRRPAP